MNICQTICYQEPSKFGWLLFAQAAVQSIGHQSLYKLIRWADQDVANHSYGLPQLACFLAKKGYLDPRRAAFVLLLCENEGWHEWTVGDGLRDILEVAREQDRPSIFQVVFSKLLSEHPFGDTEYLWTSLHEALKAFPSVAKQEDLDRLASSSATARARNEEESLRRNGPDSAPDFGAKSSEEEARQTEEAFDKIIENCDLASPASIDEAIRSVRHDRRFMFNAGERIIEVIRARCPFGKRSDFIQMLAELTELDFAEIVKLTKECVALWAESSLHIAENKNTLIRNIFDLRGVELFDLRYSGILREISKLVDFSSNAEFVLNLVLDTVAKEKIELSGDGWLQIATSLCGCVTGQASLQALEALLSGPAARFGDEIGEGKFKAALAPTGDQATMMAEITWHLLGNADAFVRWRAARAIKGLADLGLQDDIMYLVQSYDRIDTEALMTEGYDASFLNARQWMLMGLARACLYHGSALAYLREPLETMAAREDVHVLNKRHVFRCLEHISSASALSQRMEALRETLYEPAKGYAKQGSYPKPVERSIEFSFDYDFEKSDVSGLARLFGIPTAEAADAVANEIQRTWPDAKAIEYFSGASRYHHRHTDRYENFRESVAKHALISAATTLANVRPVIRDSNDPIDERPWFDWLQGFDVSFENGAWLADQKDRVPDEAKKYIAVRANGDELLECEATLLEKLGLAERPSGSLIPICASWRSSDDVRVRITAALAQPKGLVGRCEAFSKLPDHEMWLPSFASNGEEDHHDRRSEFEPFIWEPERHTTGVDAGDEYATRYAVERPGIGKRLTERFGMQPDTDRHSWRTVTGKLALQSQVWGQWRPEPSDHRGWYQNEGMILWAEPDWLDKSLSALNRRLVFRIDLHKYKSNFNYRDDSGLRAVYIALLNKDGTLRTWKAKQASKTVY